MNTLLFSDTSNFQIIARRFKKGELHRIRKGIYIDSFDKAEISRVLENKWPQIASFLFTNPLIIARTAAELKPADGKLYFVSASLTSRRTIDVGHLLFNISPGNVVAGTIQFNMELKKSDRARTCLENLAQSRGTEKNKKTLGPVWVENELLKVIQEHNEKALNELRIQAKDIARAINLEKEFVQLNLMISAILNSHPTAGLLPTNRGIAPATNKPYDHNRLERFKAFAKYLGELNLTTNNYTYNGSSWRNLSFFESYFSNYIEGTEFLIEEVEEIIFKKEEIYLRHEDSHDVISHMEICSDMSEMKRVPNTAIELVNLLKTRHRLLLAARPNKRPGLFKKQANQAGSTQFVLPEHLEATLVQGFSIYQQLPKGIQRAIFIHFLVTECHPFDDGNGRLARIMMNAELVSADQFKIIMPTVHRESYLLSLKNATRLGIFRTNVKVLHQMQCYTAAIEWQLYDEVKANLKKHAAVQEPDDGIATFNNVICRLGDDYPPG